MTNVGFSWKDILDPLGVRKLFEKKRVVVRRTAAWSIRSADAAHQLLLAAGAGNVQAQGQLNAIKAAAASGDPTATRVMALMNPVARMVQLNLGSPSMLLARRGGSFAQVPAQRQAQTIKKQQEQLKAMRQQQVQQAQKAAFHAKVQLRFKEEQDKYDAEANAYEDKIADLQKQLERRDMKDEMREQLEAQAAQYEAEIDRIEAAKAALQEAAPAVAAVAAATAVPAAPPAAEAPAPAEEAAPVPPGDVELNQPE